MNTKVLAAVVLGATLMVGGVASAANWNGLENYPEVQNSAHGTETYYFDLASQFKGIDGSRNFVFGINVINMHNNQYGDATLYKYMVEPSQKLVYKYDMNGNANLVEPGTAEYAMFEQVWETVYNVKFIR
ncbi:MAG: hypothetical protein KBB81_07135 [Veillonella sp.]|uniref:hypothetical protein n=1 Tax=Veillonella sp. TaxID=1926307 RepID=UPI001B3ED2E8|nr:hypothetical protein [Veillonella sp.]MBP6923644.1 hypothetical protein [Veillonella sp.]MBP8616628.1 hypothetical protein [Veillonella sp.]